MELQWPLMVFTLFVCLGAGIFGVQGLLAVLGKGEKIQLPCLVASLVSIGIGGIGSFLHLEHWERIFNGFGHLTSGITQELIAIVVIVFLMVVYFIMMRRSEDGKAPKWCGVMAIIVSIVLVAVMSHSYNMVARPAWDTPLLWLYYLANGILFGGLAVAIISGVKGDESTGLAIKASIVGGIVQALAAAAYAVYFAVSASAFTKVGYYFDPTHPTKEMIDPGIEFGSIFAGENAALFWLGVVVVGVVIPLIAAILCHKKESNQVVTLAAVGLICALVGGMCFRVILYLLGYSVFVFY